MERPARPEGLTTQNYHDMGAQESALYLEHQRALDEYLDSIAKGVLAFLSRTDLGAKEAKSVLNRAKFLLDSKRDRLPLSAVLKSSGNMSSP